VSLRLSSEDHQAFTHSVAGVLSRECDSSALHAFIDKQAPLDATVWTRGVELGWLSAVAPGPWGGLDLGVRGADVLFRELGRRAAPGGLVPTLIASLWLSGSGGDELQAAMLPAIVAGETVVAIPVGEPSTRLRLENGRLSGVAPDMLGWSTASVAIAPAVTARGEIFVAVRINGVNAQLSFDSLWDRTRQVGVLRCEAAEPLGIVDDLDGAAARLMRRLTALAIAGDSLGGAREAAEQTISYTKGREQFGRPVAAFQGLKHRIADVMVEIVASEHLLRYALDVVEDGGQDADLWAALAKADACEAYERAAEEAVLLHGGVGFTWAFDCHLFLKRARLNEQLGGDRRRLRDAAADLLRQAAWSDRSTAEIAT